MIKFRDRSSKNADKTNNAGKTGKTSTMFVINMANSSIRPPLYAAIPPTIVAIRMVITPTINPTKSEFLTPCATLAK